VLLARDVTEHRGAALGDLGCADGRGDVVVAGRDVGGEEAERREFEFSADYAQKAVVPTSLSASPHAEDMTYRHLMLPPDVPSCESVRWGSADGEERLNRALDFARNEIPDLGDCAAPAQLRR
jgi:hypothetical protein